MEEVASGLQESGWLGLLKWERFQKPLREIERMV